MKSVKPQRYSWRQLLIHECAIVLSCDITVRAHNVFAMHYDAIRNAL